jgi:hypothetical protein
MFRDLTLHARRRMQQRARPSKSGQSRGRRRQGRTGGERGEYSRGEWPDFANTSLDLKPIRAIVRVTGDHPSCSCGSSPRSVASSDGRFTRDNRLPCRERDSRPRIRLPGANNSVLIDRVIVVHLWMSLDAVNRFPPHWIRPSQSPNRRQTQSR